MRFKLLILFSIVIVNIFGQFSYSPPPMHDFHNQMMFNNFSYNQAQKYGCIAFMKDGTKVEGDSYLHNGSTEFSGIKMSYLKIDKQKITPTDTDSVMVNSKIGYPHSGRWIFKMNSGKINSFNTKPVVLDNKFSFLQKDNATIENYSKDLLKRYISDNKLALGEFNSYYKQNTTSYLFFGAGIALIVGGFLSLPATEDDQPQNNP
ncbi:MAG: hypothetical protein K8S23_16240 [Candidatus Cloacimonetes bacterium]|nr:hypothetical protein [Candidatus Cloacimonadota bacterium]